jgi:maltooligosyltrehalose trehalohydrolase
MSWSPSLGAWIDGTGVRFRVWAPDAAAVRVVIESPPEGIQTLDPEPDGYHTAYIQDIGAGTRYRYLLDDRGPFPDPCSRYQPLGVHGPSEVVDPATFRWTDVRWQGLPLEEAVTYEMHVGTFTPEGTYASAAGALPRLVELGVTAVQIMPLADFAGDRNWGYDGVSMFAPARCYGAPADLRALVDRAHVLGLAVILDVVYNHFGPDGAYHSQFSKAYFNPEHNTLWGAAINLDGPGSEAVRAFFIESAEHWLHEYHVDGFRLDSTHALVDTGPRHFLEEYTSRVHGSTSRRHPPIVIAEDHRNQRMILDPPTQGGYGMDAVLADDFHHEVRRVVAGDDEGYYEDYHGTASDLVTSLERGWLFIGQFAPYWHEARGTDPEGIALPHFIHCIQNHDQVGNRPFGDRLTETCSLEAYRAASALLLFSAATPMLFMGQEWAASTPFQFFTDHHEELGRLVTEGRRSEFGAWDAFRSEALRDRIPDPQALATFERSRLDWGEREASPHRGVLALYQQLLQLRGSEPALRWTREATYHAIAPDEDTVVVCRQVGQEAMLLVCRLRGGPASIGIPPAFAPPPGHPWRLVLTTEGTDYTDDPLPIEVTDEAMPRCAFARPGAALFRAQAEAR